MEIKYELLLNGMTWSAADDIQYNNIGALKTSESTTPGYYIVLCTANSYTLKEQYTCHIFDPPVIIIESELVCPAKFMTPMRKTSYWYHEPDEAIPVMVNLKQVVVPYIEFIQEKNTTNNLPSRFKGYTNTKPNLLSKHNHQIILDKIEARENMNHDEYAEDGNYYNVDSDNYDDGDN